MEVIKKQTTSAPFAFTGKPVPKIDFVRDFLNAAFAQARDQ
jgi:hypothetical protein